MNITLQNITKIFPGRGRKQPRDVAAVSHLSFEIPDGLLIGLLGPSGCGKSTALNMICGLETPTEGRIFFGDRDVTDLPPEHRGVGMVFQNYALYPHLTVRQNILFPLENRKGAEKLSKPQMLQMADKAAALVQIGDLMDRRPGELSGGQQQRVAIARALVKMPHVLLLDEPLSNLDARLRLQTREEIRKIQRSTGITTIFVTHDQEEALSISDQIVVMKKGVLQQAGKPQDVYDNPRNLFVAKFLGTPPINVFHGVVRDGALYLGEDAVLPAASLSSSSSLLSLSEDGTAAAGQDDSSLSGASGAPRQVTVGIRPEAFVPNPEGPLRCTLSGVEVMGRDVSILSAHPAAETSVIRSIVSAEQVPAPDAQTVRFSLKPHKVFLFDRQSGERIDFESRQGGRL